MLKYLHMQSITVRLNEHQLQKIIQDYHSFIMENDGAYVIFKAVCPDLIIRIYRNSHNDKFKATFQGERALMIAQKYDPQATIKASNNKVNPSLKGYLDINEQAGSDEVGFGDLFGPVVVVAAYMQARDFSRLQELGVTDSKKMTDEHILTIGPLLEQSFDHVSFVVDNQKLNELFANNYNMNKIKAMLHNRALRLLTNRHPGEYPLYIDQFCSNEKFNEYLSEKRAPRIVMHTKGESLFPAVALASVIARYKFLLAMDKLGRINHEKLPFGAGVSVDAFALEYINRHGFSSFAAITKHNFRNYRDLAARFLID